MQGEEGGEEGEGGGREVGVDQRSSVIFLEIFYLDGIPKKRKEEENTMEEK